MELDAISLLTHRRLVDDIERHRSDAGELIECALEEARKFLDESGVRLELQASPTR